MEIIAASLPLAVRAPGLQPRASLASIQSTQNSGAALAIARSGRAPAVTVSDSSVRTPDVRTQFAPATVIPPLTELALPVSPASTAVASVAEVFRSTPLAQHKERRLDVFDVAFAARKQAAHPQMLSGHHLNLFA